jgi:hypothetical protein
VCGELILTWRAEIHKRIINAIFCNRQFCLQETKILLITNTVTVYFILRKNDPFLHLSSVGIKDPIFFQSCMENSKQFFPIEISSVKYLF